MRIRNKEELEKRARSFIESSQRLKAAQEVLQHERDVIIPAFNQFCRSDEDGNRTISFGPTKIMLVPQRKVDEAALRAKLGSDVHRYTERTLAISLHTIQHKLGEEVAQKVSEAVASAVVKVLGNEPTIVRNSIKVSRTLNVDAALASLPKEQQKEVKVEVSQTLRPYPEKQGYTSKIKAALRWLRGE